MRIMRTLRFLIFIEKILNYYLFRFGFQSDSLLVGVAARTVLSFSITMHVWNLYFYILTVHNCLHFYDILTLI